VEIFFTDYAALAVPVDGLGTDEARRRVAGRQHAGQGAYVRGILLRRG
jgi:hypothetical protein